MLLRRTNGWHPINRLQEEMDRLANQFGCDPLWRGEFGVSTARAFPAMNVWEDEQNLNAEAELPGLTLDDIALFVVGNELTIKGERKQDSRPETAFHRRERGIGAFSRVVRLPVNIDGDKVDATLRNGVLTVKLPKAPEARPRKVEVKAR